MEVELEEIITEREPVRFAVDEQGVIHAIGEEIVNEISGESDSIISTVEDEPRFPSIIQQSSPFICCSQENNECSFTAE